MYTLFSCVFDILSFNTFHFINLFPYIWYIFTSCLRNIPFFIVMKIFTYVQNFYFAFNIQSCLLLRTDSCVWHEIKSSDKTFFSHVTIQSAQYLLLKILHASHFSVVINHSQFLWFQSKFDIWKKLSFFVFVKSVLFLLGLCFFLPILELVC